MGHPPTESLNGPPALASVLVIIPMNDTENYSHQKPHQSDSHNYSDIS